LREQGIGVNLILAHHPLIFSPLKTVVEGDPVGDMVRQAIAHNIGVYTAHTNFDQVQDGTADLLAQVLRCKTRPPWCPPSPALATGGWATSARP
jgi:putative NIF3 family GTP cyclohydrolase 1 type 2